MTKSTTRMERREQRLRDNQAVVAMFIALRDKRILPIELVALAADPHAPLHKRRQALQVITVTVGNDIAFGRPYPERRRATRAKFGI